MLQMAHIIITITINIIISISMIINNFHLPPREGKRKLVWRNIFSDKGKSSEWKPGTKWWLEPFSLSGRQWWGRWRCLRSVAGSLFHYSDRSNPPTPQTAEHCIADCSSLWIIHRASYLTRFNRSNCFILSWVELTDDSVAKRHHCHLFQ